jgi:hypothetical protein
MLTGEEMTNYTKKEIAIIKKQIGAEIDHVICPRCNCCEVDWQECEYCSGEGVSGHDCGEDSCCCLDPEDNIQCDMCYGHGGWYQCIGNCNENGKHIATASQASDSRTDEESLN